jgi:hypothetical protein
MKIVTKRFGITLILVLIVAMLLPMNAFAVASNPPRYNTTHELRTDVEQTITIWNGVKVTVPAGEVPAKSTLWVKYIPHMGPVEGQYPLTEVYRFGIYDPSGDLIRRPWGRICIPISDTLLATVVAKKHYLHFVWSNNPLGGEPWKEITTPQYDVTTDVTYMCGWGYINPGTFYTVIEK